MKYAIAAIAALLLAAPGALASPAQQAVDHAASLPVAVNAQQASEHAAALRADVAAAVRAGEGSALLGSHDPDLLSALLPYAQTAGSSAPPSHYAPPARAARKRAHAAGCYGSPWNQLNWTEYGGTVAWIYVRENGWCGDSGRIWWYGGPTFAAWTWGPFCLGNRGSNYSWDVWPSWIHMAHWGSLGVSYPWGCFTYSGGKVVLRIAWNGYWDEYNDYGF
jgi:hypothetical protein